MDEQQKQMLKAATEKVLQRLNGKRVSRLTLAKMVNEETEKLMQGQNNSPTNQPQEQ